MADDNVEISCVLVVVFRTYSGSLLKEEKGKRCLFCEQ